VDSGDEKTMSSVVVCSVEDEGRPSDRLPVLVIETASAGPGVVRKPPD
jgi:hypothetical protein